MISLVYQYIQKEHVVSVQTIAYKFHITVERAQEILHVLTVQGVFPAKTDSQSCGSFCTSKSCAYAKKC